MAKRLEGIVIEIGGDTTQLGKALEDVNKSTGSLSKELKGVETMLKLDPTNVELVRQKQELLNATIEETKRKLGILKGAQEEVQAQFNKGEITAQQYRDFQREIISTEQKLNKLNNELKETSSAEKKIDFKAVRAGLSDFGEKAGHVAMQVGKVTAALVTGLAAAVGSIAAKMVSAAVNAGEFADELLATASKANISAETLQQWRYAAEFIDTDVETMTGSMAKMTKVLGKNEEAFASLGIATRDAGGNFLSQEEIFYSSIDALNGVENATQRDILAQQLFGKSAAELNPLLKAGGDELRRLSEEAIASGAVISGPVLQQFASFDDTMQKLKMQFGAAGKNIVAAFLPAIQGLAGPLTDAMGQINVILSDGLQSGDMEQISQIVGDLINSLGTMIGEMLPKLIDFIVPALTNLISVLVGVLPTLLPALLDGALQLIMGLVTAVQENTEPLVQMAMTIVSNLATFLVENLPMILQTAFDLVLALVMGIVDALPVLIPQLIQVLLSIVTFILQNLPLIITVAVQVIVALIQGLVAAIPMLVDMLPQIITTIVSTLIQLTPQLVIAALQIIIALIGGLIEALPQLVAAIPAVWKAIYDGVMEGVAAIKEAGKNLLAGLWHGIQEKISWLMDGVRGVIDSVKGVFENFNLFEIGKNIIQGLIDGIKNMIGSITQVASDLVNGIKNKFLSLLGIKSPSRWMRDFVGKMIPQGIAVGVKADTSKAVLAMQDLTSQVMDASTPDMIMMMNQTPLVSTSNRIEGLKDSLGDSGSLANKMEAMVNLMAQYLPNLGKEYQLVVDSGAMVGALQPQIDRQMGSQSLLRERGV